MSNWRSGGVSSKDLRLLPGVHTQAHIHLVANTLSLVGSLLRRRPDAAEDLLAHLTLYLRNRLGSPRPLVPLADELRLVLMYVGVERARMGGRLRLEVACTPASLHVLVPSLAVQALVENAIRHGIAGRTSGGRIRIQSRVSGTVLHVAVADDGIGLRRPTAAQHPQGWGLLGIRIRLTGLWGTSARLRVLALPSGGTLAAVSLPVQFAILRRT